MPKSILKALVATTALTAATHSFAAIAPASPDDTSTLNEIVVTARRRAENLQDVPVSAQVVTGDALQKLAITQPSELSKLTPGLNLNVPRPDMPAITLRGVRWTPATGTPAIPLYLNEISFDPQQVVQTLYDIGQVEVLRGPQGTARGAPSISGAITITTRRPDLNNYGGYVSGQVGTHGHWDVQGAVNVPLIQDKLAVRLAANFENSELDQVHSINSSTDPSMHLRSGRITVRYEPTDDIQIVAMYQRMNQISSLFQQVAGTGSLGTPALGLPPNFNGPAISPKEYLAVGDAPSTVKFRTDLITLNATWDFLGQRLSYNFGYQNAPSSLSYTQDVGNLLPGFEDFLNTNRGDKIGQMWNELRLSSLRGRRFFDYDIGFYENNSISDLVVGAPGSYLPGAFGSPSGVPSPFGGPLARYVLRATTNISLATQDYSVYGDLTFHLPYDIELTGGLRWIHDRRPTQLNISTTSAFAAFANPAAGLLACETIAGLSPQIAGAVTSPVYPGACDLPVAAQTLPVQAFGKTYTPVIYNVSLSHKFTPDLLGYFTVGSSWRAGLPAINNTGLPSNLLFPDPEKATSYEVGFKSTWLDRRLRINADVFQISYTGQLTQFAGVPYFNSVGNSISQTSIAFLYNVNARVRGAEADIAAEPIHNLTLNLNLSYSHIESTGGQAPCNDPTRPITATNTINFCPIPSGETLNASSPLQATFSGDYVVPMGPLEGYLRFNANFQGHNPNFGISEVEGKSYTLVDLFAGVNGGQGAWTVGLYAKNVFDKKVLLTSLPIVEGAGVDALFGPSGYNAIGATLPREVGLQGRYAFGAR